MVSEVELYLERSKDEFFLAENDLKLSTDLSLKELLGVEKNKTFFHSVIQHSYYAIFHCAKAYLFSKNVKTSIPNEHLKTYFALKNFVDRGVLDKELLKIYEYEVLKADVLLDIFKTEKWKRGTFIYNVRSEANLPYAKESIENSRIFISTIKKILEK